MKAKVDVATIWKNAKDKNYWGYLVNPEQTKNLVGSVYPVVCTQKEFNIPEQTNNNMILDFTKNNTIAYLTPSFTDEDIAMSYYYINLCEAKYNYYIWNIDAESLALIQEDDIKEYYLIKESGKTRLLEKQLFDQFQYRYETSDAQTSGDLTWFKAKKKNSKLVVKNFAGVTYANLMEETDFQKLLGKQN